MVLNLRYSVQVHEKRYGVLSSAEYKFIEPFGLSGTDASLLGTKAFPALNLPKDSNFLPYKTMDKCGIGACASIAIVLRDVIAKDAEQQHDGKNEYEKNFCVKSLPLLECLLTQEVFCNMPKVLLDPLPTKENL
jgi:hypothetical protein